jgi:hypothetical protein
LPLQRVALLYDAGRLHFSLAPETGANGGNHVNDQLAKGHVFAVGRSTQYKVKVTFNGRLYGVFTQCVVFDFGTRPVVGRTLRVDLQNDELQRAQRATSDLRAALAFKR